MKIGCSWNVFDGEELLEGSIKQIRSEVDYVSVVYQTISNFGNPCDPNLVPLLNRLKDEGLIDELYEYKPKLDKGGHYNEITKRNIGLSLSMGVKCTHHMSLDSDEYYKLEEFKYLKNKMIEGNYDSSYCQMLTYYKSWEYVLDPPETYYVSLLYKIKENSNYVMGVPSPVLVDPTRRMFPSENPIIFEREYLQMYHGSYIRKNIGSKLTNSSSNNKNWDINKLIKFYNEFNDGDKGLMFKPYEEYVNLKKIEKIF
jgi:hypothetical protein